MATTKIKHVVISGGSIYGLSYYGILKHLFQQHFLDHASIETMHATSIGCVISVFAGLSMEWGSLDKYLVNRPWQDVFPITLFSLINCVQTNGIFNIDVIRAVFLPVFRAMDIDIGVTMQELYDRTNIEMHFYTVEVCEFRVVDLSYRTHPHWTVVECVYASCCVPILFQPLTKDGLVYTDGGVLCNCPLQELMTDSTIAVQDPKEVLCINIGHKSSLAPDFDISSFLFVLFSNMIHQNTHTKYMDKVHYINVDQIDVYIFDIGKICRSPEERIRLVAWGEKIAALFLNGIADKTNGLDEEKKQEEEEEEKEKGR
jgi:predicted acylesterase/phospholipase RssA